MVAKKGIGRGTEDHKAHESPTEGRSTSKPGREHEGDEKEGTREQTTSCKTPTTYRSNQETAEPTC
eukprot:2652525-Prorocentrum_lima.AAC.1